MPCTGVYCEDPSLIRPTRLDWTDCLRCAAGDHACSLPYPLLKAIRDDQEKGHYWPSVTSLTGCLRKSWLEHTLNYYEYPSRFIPLLVGTAFHSFLEYSNGNGSLAEVHVRWTTPEGITLGGVVDQYVPGRKLMRDWKTAKKITLSKLPYGSHEAQTNVYAYMLARNEVQPKGEVERIEVVYFDKTGADTKNGEHNGVAVVEIPLWPAGKTEQYIRQRAAILKGALDGRTIPPMIDRQDRWLCGYCPIDIQDRCKEL